MKTKNQADGEIPQQLQKFQQLITWQALLNRVVRVLCVSVFVFVCACLYMSDHPIGHMRTLPR